jgi:hypothetical protein
MWNFLANNGSALVLMYVEAILKVPSRDVAEFYTKTLVALCIAFREDNVAYGWLQNALV